MCCNGSKKAAPRLHAVASTWSSCVEFLIQRLLLGICTNSELIVFAGDTMDAYAHSHAPNDTYLVIKNAYAEWYKDTHGMELVK